MKTKAVTKTPEPLYIDNSTMQSLVCDTRAFLRYVMHLTIPDRVAELESGIAGHEVLARFFMGQPKPKALRALRPYDTWYKEQIATGTELNERFKPENLQKILVEWMAQHPVESMPVRMNPKMIEIGFQTVLSPEHNIVLVGRNDAIVEDMTGNVAPMDNKFTGRISPAWVEKFRTDSQFSAYAYATSKHTGERCLRGYVNAIELSKLPDSDRTCSVHKLQYSQCGNMHGKSKIFVVTRTPKALKQWKSDAIDRGVRFRELKELYAKKGAKAVATLPQQGTFFNACMYCEYLTFCAHGRPVAELNNLYVKRVWNPLDHATGGNDARKV